MSGLVAIEDWDNLERIVTHHLPWDGTDAQREKLQEMIADLGRYCTRLRCQPDTGPHLERSKGTHHASMAGPAAMEWAVPGHQLIESDPESVVTRRNW